MTYVERLDIRLVEPGLSFSLGEGFQLSQELLLVEVTTEEGVSGLGGTSTYGNGRELVSAIEHRVAPLLSGLPVWETETFSRRVLDLAKLYLPPQAGAAVDCALWDALGHGHGVPVYRLLGGSGRPIPVYASLPAFPSIEETLELIDLHRSQGVGAFKVHLSGVASQDIALAEAAREHVGEDVVLLADAVGHYDHATALRVGRALEAAGFGWYEMPVEDHYGPVYSQLARDLDIPVTSGEVTDPTLFAAMEAIEHKRWDILRVDVCNSGGITQGRKIAALAEAGGLSCEFHSWGFTINQLANAHTMAASPTSRWFEMPVPEELFSFGFEPPEVSEGHVWLPELPGLGLQPHEDRLAERTIEHRSVRVGGN